MSRKVVVLAIVVGLLAVALVLALMTGLSRESRPSSAVEPQLRATIVKYTVAQQPLIPTKLYGKTLTIDRCVTLLRTHVQDLKAVATDSGIWPVDTGWLYLAMVRGQMRELNGAIPIKWSGRIAYWDVVRGEGSTYVVRAAVLMTMTYSRWDEKVGRLVGTNTRTYSSTSADEYTLQRDGSVWKVTRLERWMNHDSPGGLTKSV